MAVQEVARNSWICYRQNLTGLLRATAPYIAASIGLALASATLAARGSLGLVYCVGLLELVAGALISLAALKFLYSLDNIDLEIDGKKVFFYIVAMLYIGVAVGIGTLFFLVPGIIIMVATFLVPVFILKASQGPIESVASSAALIKADLWLITFFLGTFFLAIYGAQYAGGYVLGFLPLPELVNGALAEGVSLLIGLYALPVMKCLYTDLGGESGETTGEELVSD